MALRAVSGNGSGGGGTWGTIVGTLSNQTDLQAALDAKVDNLAENTLGAGNTPITRATHLNRPLIVNQAGATTGTFAATATSGALAGDSFYLRNTGAGTFTALGTITAPSGFKLTAGPDEYFSADYDSVNDAFISTTPVLTNINHLLAAPMRIYGPRTLGDNAPTGVGFGASLTAIDSSVYATPAITDGSYGAWHRTRMNTAAAGANRGAGFIHTAALAILRLDNTGDVNGGFPLIIRFALNNTTTGASRVFVGLTNNPTTSDFTADPSARVNNDCFFIGGDVASANLYVGWNNNAGSITTVSLGASFPKSANLPYYAIFSRSPAGVCQVTVMHRGTGAIATVIQSGGNAPRTTVSYGWQIMVGSGTEAVALAGPDFGMCSLGGPMNPLGT